MNQIMGGIIAIGGVIYCLRQFIPYQGAKLTTIELASQQPFFLVQVLVGCAIGGVLGYIAGNTWRKQASGESLTTQGIIRVYAIVFVTFIVMYLTHESNIDSSMFLAIETLPLKITWVATFLLISGVLYIWNGTRAKSIMKPSRQADH